MSVRRQRKLNVKAEGKERQEVVSRALSNVQPLGIIHFPHGKEVGKIKKKMD